MVKCIARLISLGTIAALAIVLAGSDAVAAEPVKSPRLVRLTRDGYFKQRPAWSPDGKRLVFARHASEKIWLYELEVESGKEHRLTSREPPEYDAVWSPDGQQLAFSHVTQSGTQGDVDVRLIKADGSDIVQVAGSVRGLSHEEWPSWSPDGQQLAFTSTGPGNQEVMTAKVDGSGLARLTTHLGTDAHPAWSPDGGRIAFATDRWGGLEIAVMNCDGSDVQRLTTSRGLDDYPAWSPDGRSMVFVTNRDGNFEIYQMSAEGGDPINLSRSSAVDSFPTYTPDGRGVTFVSNRDEQFEIYTQDLE